MKFRSPLIEERSRELFGQTHRLALMIAIAHSDGRVNPTDLSSELGLAQSAFQAPLRDLAAAELVTREVFGRRNFYTRQDSKVWAWILELEERLAAEEARQQTVRSLRSS